MKITITGILFPVLVALVAHPCAAQDATQDEEHSTLRGLKGNPYTVALNKNLTNPGVYFGTGNSNGRFVIATSVPNKAGKRVRIGLRANEAFVGGITPNPLKPYEFMIDTGPGKSRAATRPKWNFDYDFDSDVNCPVLSTTCTPLSTYKYEVAMDVNPTIGTTWIKFDPINQEYADHSLGKSDTDQSTDLVIPGTIGAGTDADPKVPNPDRFNLYAEAIRGVTIHLGGRLHGAQNSFSYAFLAPFGIPNFNVGVRDSRIDTEGIYDVVLSIKEKSGKLLAKAAIRVLVKDPTKCGGASQPKCFPELLSDCNAINIKQWSFFFTSKQTKECQSFVTGIKQ